MIVTYGRADYGLLYPLIKKILSSYYFDLRLVATGTHLSIRHGKTIKLIKKDGLKITDTVAMTTTSDTEDAICHSISTGLVKFSKLFSKNSPDLLIVLGDRYEPLAVCTAALIHKIPIAHISGGEITRGAIDDSIRHAITKMSALHFPCLNLYAQRIIQMGENPKRIFMVGALGMDNIKNTSLMTHQELSDYTGVDFNKKIALMTFHPVTLDDSASAQQQINEILLALRKTNLLTVITMPNADAAGNIIYKKIKKAVRRYPKKFILIKNLGQRGYLSTLKYAELMIGNSSSGITEGAAFRLPVVNIGDRQAGRFKPANVIDCACSKKAISQAIKRARSQKFKQSIARLKNPYGNGQTAERIVRVLKSIDFRKDKLKLLKKGFYDEATISRWASSRG